MAKTLIIFCLFPVVTSSIVYIDRVKSGFSPKAANLTVDYTHNTKGASVTNVTIETYVTVVKLLAYVSIRIPESGNDREYKLEVFKTVADVEKALNGLQSNPVVKGYVENLLKYIDFEVDGVRVFINKLCLAMSEAAIVLCLFPVFATCIIYIDRANSGSNQKLCEVTVNYTHNTKGDSVTNVTFENHVSIAKLLIYASVRIAENKNDREYNRELLRTVVDVEKAFRGLQSNPLVKGYAENILKYADFEIKFPFKPGAYRFVNVIIDTSYVPTQLFPHDMKGCLNLRIVMKNPNISKMQYFGFIEFYGGLKKD